MPVLARQGGLGAEGLLRQGAGLVTTAEDVLAALDGQPLRRVAALPEDPDAARALEELRLAGELSLDQLAGSLGWSVSRAATALMRLQLGAFVQQEPGGRFAAMSARP